MLEVNGNRGRNNAGSCRSRRREIFSHRSSFEWEEGLRDIKPRRDQSISVLDDLRGHYPMRNPTNSMLTSGSSLKNQTSFDPLDCEGKRSSMKKSSCGASIRSLIDEEMSKNVNFRKQSPSVIAKLMGLDPLPAQNFSSIQNSLPSQSRGRSSEEFKDVYEDLESKKSPVCKRSPSKSGRRDGLNGIHGSREFSEKWGGYQAFEDPFLKLLNEPSSLFVRQSVESHRSDASQIVVLKASSDLRKSDRRIRTGYEDEDLLTHCIKEHALSLSSKTRDPERWSAKREANPTRIVVLKPSLDGAWDETAESEFESSSRRESRRYCAKEMPPESRERKKLSGNSSRGIAREITENMIRNDGAAKFSRPSRSSCREKISGSYVRSIESSLGQEARKRLLERWKTANRSLEIGAPRRSSGATLAEMLISSEREFPAVENSGDLISREEILARWGSPLGITSSRSPIRGRRRSSCPNFGSPKSLGESFSRRDSLPSIERPGDRRDLNISLTKSAAVKEVPCLTANAAVDSESLTGEDHLEDSYATEEETPSDKQETRGKDFASSVEVAEHYSPVSVLDPPDERETSLDRFDRIKVDLQELLPESEHPKSTAEDAEAEEIRLTFEDEDNLEFCYLLDILIDSGLYKADRGTLLCGCFSLESPVDPQVFENLESIYKQLTWTGMNRKLMFDLVNSILAEISDSLVGKVNFRGGSRKVLVEEVWESLLKKSTLYEACQSNSELDEMTWRGSGVDFHGLGVEIENMLNDYLLEELVAEVGSL